MVAKLLPPGYLIEYPASTPDLFHFNTNNFSLPNDNFVISRNQYGKIVSVYSDMTWDLTPYSSLKFQTQKVYFERNIHNNINAIQQKRIFFLLMTMASGNSGAGLSVTSLVTLSSMINSMTLYAEKKDITLFEFLSNNHNIHTFINLHLPVSYSSRMASFLIFLHQTDNKITGIRFMQSEENLAKLRKVNTEKKYNVKQTEVIPTSILSNSLKVRWNQVNEIMLHIDSLCSFIEGCIESKYFAASDKFHGLDYLNCKECVFWDKAIHDYKLTLLFKKYAVTNKKKLMNFIRKIQGTCYHLILAYSGMRRSEALSLTTNCIDFSNDNKYTSLIGFTTKLESSRTEVKWVTSREIEVVVKLLTKLSNSLSLKLYFSDNEQPLFISTSNLTSKPNKEPSIIANPFLNMDTLPIDEKLITIQEQHIHDLEQIDYNRDWRNEEDFKIGTQWRFKTHQYRRSLAVYSIQSGLISLGALQNQFKHLFKEMSYYYQNGSAHAKNIFDLKQQHVAKDLEKLKPELEALSYIKNVLLSDDTLHGVHGNIVTKKVKNTLHNDKLLILKNREKTMKNFKDGYMAWTETMLGGCIQVEPCESKVTKSLIACIGCESGVHKLQKLNQAIITQNKFIDKLNPKSIEYRIEKTDLEKLISYRDNIAKEKNDNN